MRDKDKIGSCRQDTSHFFMSEIAMILSKKNSSNIFDNGIKSYISILIALS